MKSFGFFYVTLTITQNCFPVKTFCQTSFTFCRFYFSFQTRSTPVHTRRPTHTFPLRKSLRATPDVRVSSAYTCNRDAGSSHCGDMAPFRASSAPTYHKEYQKHPCKVLHPGHMAQYIVLHAQIRDSPGRSSPKTHTRSNTCPWLCSWPHHLML